MLNPFDRPDDRDFQKGRYQAAGRSWDRVRRLPR